MRAPRFLRRHSRWHEQIDATVDGELTTAQAAQLERHLSGCDACRARVGHTRALRAAMAALPQVEAPRSFRITPGMLEHERAKPARGLVPQVAWRSAQFATAFAVTALIAVFVIDAGRSPNNHTASPAGAPERDTKAASAPAASQDSAAPLSAATAPAGEPAATPAPGGVIASGAPPPSPSTQTTGGAESPLAIPSPADRTFASGPGDETASSATIAPETAHGTPAPGSDDSDLRPLELALVAIAVAGGSSTLALHVYRRRA